MRTINYFIVPAITLLVNCSVGALSAGAAELAPGIDLGADYVQDIFSDVGGGQRRGTAAPGLINLSAAIDGRSWGGSVDNQFYVDYLATVGSSISHYAGDLQGLDNIEAYNTTKLYSAWYQHNLDASGSMVRIGLQDWNALFDYTDAAALFINSSFGLDAVTGVTNVSQYPTTAVGAVARWQSASGMYVMGGVYDGVPGKPGHPAGTHIDFDSGDGVFSSMEFGVVGGGDKPYKLAIGGWYQTSRYRDSAGRPRNSDYGFYLIGQQRLLGGPTTPTLDAFLQASAAQADRNPLDRYIGAGLDLTGFLPDRPNDVLGLAVAIAHTSGTYRRATGNSEHAETVIELTYRARISEHFLVQPDVQYIVDPGANRNLDNATVVGVRASFEF